MGTPIAKLQSLPALGARSRNPFTPACPKPFVFLPWVWSSICARVLFGMNRPYTCEPSELIP